MTMRFATTLLLLLLLVAPAPAQFVNPNTVSPSNTSRVLCSIRGANFNSTADQSCVIPGTITAWVPTSIVVTNCSTSLTLAAGGVYPAAAKAGTALVAAAQVYTALTGASVVLGLTLAANIATTRYAVSTVYLSLTLAQGGAATCDFYLVGVDLT